MNELQIAEKWNAQADEYNQWDALSTDEKVEFAFKEGMLAAAELIKNDGNAHGWNYHEPTMCKELAAKIIKATEGL